MHRNVGPAFHERGFQLFDKQAFAADFGQRAVQNLVTQCGHAEQLHAVPQGLQAGFDMLCLPQSQPTFPGRNYNFHGANLTAKKRSKNAANASMVPCSSVLSRRFRQGP